MVFTHDAQIVTKFLLTWATLLLYARHGKNRKQLFLSQLFETVKQMQVLLYPVSQSQDSDIEINLLLNSAWD